MTTKETKIPTIEEMKKKALKIAENIPNIKEKQKFMTEIRGFTIEFSIMIELCFNQFITETGKDLVFDHENKGLYLIKGLRNKKNLPNFKTKSNDMKKLIEELFPKLDNISKSNLSDALMKFEAIRNIFAHVPVDWNSNPLKFIINIPYKHFFKLDSKWEDVLYANVEFINLFNWIIEIILNYNRNILLKKEIYSQILLGKSSAEIEEEAKKLEGKNE